MKRFTLRAKITALIMTMIVTGLCVLGALMYRSIESTIENEMGKNARSMAVFLSHAIEKDISKYKELKSKEDESGQYYREMKNYFQYVKKDTEIKFIYTEKKLSDTKVAYVLDSEPIGSPDSSGIGDEDAMNVLRQKAYDSGKPVFGGIVDDPVWGKFITAYAPIKDTNTGELVGLVGVDIKAESVYFLLNNVRGIVVMGIIMISALSLLGTIYLSGNVARMISFDKLTGTLNKHQLEDVLKNEMNLSELRNKAFSVLMIDIDNFKNMNDTYGHQFGDEVLVSVSKLLRGSIDCEDSIIRFGGEEFIVVLSGKKSSEAFEVSKKIKDSVESCRIFNKSAHEMLNVTVSIAISAWRSGMSKDDLIGNADKALYISKSSGRNAITIYRDGI